jgi:hypothetical protein
MDAKNGVGEVGFEVSLRQGHHSMEVVATVDDSSDSETVERYIGSDGIATTSTENALTGGFHLGSMNRVVVAIISGILIVAGVLYWEDVIPGPTP